MHDDGSLSPLAPAAMLKTPPLNAQDFVVALDERGKDLSSSEFARVLAQVRICQQIAQLWIVLPRLSARLRLRSQHEMAAPASI